MKLLLCCKEAKKQKDLLWANDLKHPFLDGAYNKLIDDLPKYLLNNKIVIECDFKVEEIENNVCGFHDYKLPYFETETLTGREIEERSCLSYGELKGVLQNNGNGFYGYSGYVIYIKNLHIFNEPKGLDNYFTDKLHNNDEIMIDGKWYGPVTKAPKNMMRVKRILQEDGIIITVSSEELCRILNEKQDIIVRKKVLKGDV